MDRFYFTDVGPAGPTFEFGEFQLLEQDGVRIYDGDSKTQFGNGRIVLTSHRLIWTNKSVEKRSLCLPLQVILMVEEESGGFMKSPKVKMSLSSKLPGQPHGPASQSSGDVIKFSFKDGGERSFTHYLHDALKQRQWEMKVQQLRRPTSSATAKKTLRSGIGGIEKSIQQKAKQTDSEISQAFKDLDKLMEMAKPMVTLAKRMSEKMKGDISDDETVQFKSYLLSMGISDPVTRETHGSGQTYYRELAKEVYRVLDKPIQEAGGMITLTDAFCRVNRARGLELLSPEDLLAACQALKSVNLPLELYTFPDSGAIVLRDPDKDAALRSRTVQVLDELGSVTAEEFSQNCGISVILARERLLAAESNGDACRDDTVEGLRFYPNKFLTHAL